MISLDLPLQFFQSSNDPRGVAFRLDEQKKEDAHFLQLCSCGTALSLSLIVDAVNDRNHGSSSMLIGLALGLLKDLPF